MTQTIMSDECVYLDGDFMIVKSVRIFGAGFNCYKAKNKGSSEFQKINKEWSFFTSLETAKSWLDNHRQTNG